MVYGFMIFSYMSLETLHCRVRKFCQRIQLTNIDCDVLHFLCRESLLNRIVIALGCSRSS
jgi:hypothetical protein